ncbi:MAG: DNA primase [Acidithiobacillus sp.]
MARFSQAFIDTVLARSDILRLIDSRVPLKKKGKDYWACCPFHQEKSPSFSVSPDKQIYYCFGCHAHGNAIGFLMAYERLSFVEAVGLLAEEAGVPLPEEGLPEGPDPRPLRAILEAAARLYREALQDHGPAQAYWQQRGLSSATQERFGLGYAPDQGQFLLSRLGQNAAQRELLVGAGLVSRRDDGRYYDRFRGRVLFPLRDGRGQLCGFAGRSMDGREPKYLNSPETILYHKGQMLYGLDLAREGIRQRRQVVLVEGYLDVITLHQAGLDFAVAASGTALTEKQLETLWRSAPEVVLCFDGDAAGGAAAWRALQLAPAQLRPGRLLRVLFLPQGEDPDSLVRTRGAAAFEDILAQARPALDHYLAVLQERYDLRQADEKAQFLREAREFLAKVEDSDLRAVYGQRLEEMVGVSVSLPPPVAKAAPVPVKAPRTGRPSLCQAALRLLLQCPSELQWQGLERRLLVYLAEEDPYAEMLADALEILSESTHIESRALFARLSARRDLVGMFREQFAPSLQSDAASQSEVRDCVERLNLKLAQARMRFIGRTADRSGLAALSPEERQELLRITKGRRSTGEES